MSRVLFILKCILSRFSTRRRYKIVRGYFHRTRHRYFDDTRYTDEFQNEVYALARDYCESHRCRTILDIGCGSGFKLMKYFSAYDTIGIDVPRTVSFLREKYPSRLWLSSDEITSVQKSIDMVVCADVIEHVPDPDHLLKTILSFSPKTVIISTPDRKLRDLSDYFGPPGNSTHLREWTFHEFAEYLAEYFEIIRHEISNYAECTQVVVCKPKQEQSPDAE